MIVKITKFILSFLSKRQRQILEPKFREIFYFLKKQPSHSFFLLHEFFLSLKFNKPVDYDILGPIPTQLNKKIIKMCDNVVSMTESSLENNPLLIMETHSKKILKKLDENILGVRGDLSVYRDIHQWLRPQLRKYINSPFSIVNTRTWISKPQTSRFGPNESHTDGFYNGHIKVMLYSTPLNYDFGQLVIGDQCITNLQPGSSVAFRNSDIMHSGIPGNKENRISTEITCFRSFVNNNQDHEGALLGRHYKSFSTPYLLYFKKNSFMGLLKLVFSKIFFLDKIKFSTNSYFLLLFANFISLLNYIIKPKNINIGSGRKINFGWYSIDEIIFPGVHKIKLDTRFKYPFKEKSINIAYSSHNFEHLSDNSLKNVLYQTHKVLKDDGYFIIKVPDVEYFLDKYKKNDTNFMSNLGYESVTWSWKNKNVSDNLENRVAMMICGYWNKEYGDHFSGRVNINDNAYHGPPIIDQKKLKRLLKNNSIRDICVKLRSIPKKRNDFKNFNHQNAWSKNDLIKLVKKYGFIYVDLDKDQIIKKFITKVPGISEYREWSMYTVFKKY